MSNQTCTCYDGVILGPRFDVDINDVTTCPKCQGTGVPIEEQEPCLGDACRQTLGHTGKCDHEL